MKHEELTGKILEACFEVSNELGAGFLESVYEKALLVALRHKGINCRAQVPLKVKFREVIVGDFYADILVNDVVLVELKAVDNLGKEHYAQILNYLKSTAIPVGLLINFGVPKLQYRRFDNRFIHTKDAGAELADLLGEQASLLSLLSP
ncbi:MAG TPA: GxxExxY protein [Pyrinomonadaceae bacterium]|nr:GxxExxY protein [Pyrinomonadaceae bacterium]